MRYVIQNYKNFKYLVILTPKLKEIIFLKNQIFTYINFFFFFNLKIFFFNFYPLYNMFFRKFILFNKLNLSFIFDNKLNKSLIFKKLNNFINITNSDTLYFYLFNYNNFFLSNQIFLINFKKKTFQFFFFFSLFNLTSI